MSDVNSAIEQFKLKRYPPASDRSLRAWNAADQLLLNYLEQHLTTSHPQIAVFNDQFGALSTGLASFKPYLFTDSFLSARAIEKNLIANQCLSDSNRLTREQRLEIKFSQLSSEPQLSLSNERLTEGIMLDVVVLRVPKHNSLLQLQLQLLRPFVNQKTLIIAGGMTKEIHKSTLSLFENILGTTTTSLAEKKARLIFCQADKALSNDSPILKTDIAKFQIKEASLELLGLPGVFSRDKLDIGAQVLLRHLPDTHDDALVADLGCGNGVLGVSIAKRNSSAKVVCCDESALAVETARLNFEHNQLSNGKFIQSDVFSEVSQKAFDFILCNPPFHQQNVQTLAIAKQMFRQSAAKLKASGQLYVVANRHLKYAPILRRYFTQVQPISKDSKFIVWKAINPRITQSN